MKAWRGSGRWAVPARSLALFALLIQFTLPFGIAVAAGFQPGAPSTAVFDCMAGAGDGDTRLAPGHSCPLPGGCCVAPGLLSLPSAPRGGEDFLLRPSERRFENRPGAAAVRGLPPSRGPPSFL